MTFFKKLTSRSRGNSYVEDDYTRSPTDPNRPPSSYQSPIDNTTSRGVTSSSSNNNAEPIDPNNTMYPSPIQNQSHRNSSSGGYSVNATRPLNSSTSGNANTSNSGGMRNSSGRHDSSTRDSGFGEAPMSAQPGQMSPGMKTADHGLGRDNGSGGGLGGGMPDMLTRAFNEAVRPYSEKIEMLEQQLADMQDWVQGQEAQRMEIFAWIDKRGLRPDVPPSIARTMDSLPPSPSDPQSTTASSALNAQLDRKITIVNFDLHRLQDDLNDSISSAHFAAAMAKFTPDIQRLASLPAGPKFAYELLIKLVGNLNSHGGLEANTAQDALLDGGEGSDAAGGGNGTSTAAEIEEDRRARAAFYARMDDELVDVVGRRCDEGSAEWGKAGLAGEVKRLERNAAYLLNLGIESYFPRALEVMRAELRGGGGGGGARGHVSEGGAYVQ